MCVSIEQVWTGRQWWSPDVSSRGSPGLMSGGEGGGTPSCDLSNDACDVPIPLPWTEWRIDACENITFQQHHWWAKTSKIREMSATSPPPPRNRDVYCGLTWCAHAQDVSGLYWPDVRTHRMVLVCTDLMCARTGWFWFVLTWCAHAQDGSGLYPGSTGVAL